MPLSFFVSSLMYMKLNNRNINSLIAVLAFLAAYCFFQFAYPYHLMRREQMNLFLFDWDYLLRTYQGTGWLVRFTGDFLEQFFHLPVIGPLTVSLLLTAIGTLVYRICIKILGQWQSLSVAALVFIWSFLRETGNLFITRYTLVVLGYLAIIYAILQIKKRNLRILAVIPFVAVGVWMLGSPYHKHYGKIWGVPRVRYDKIIGLDTEVSRENWDKVLKLSKEDFHTTESSYCFNLAHAMKGNLGQALFDHVQQGDATLLLRVDTDKSPFTVTLAGEAWFQLGNMTVAEQSAIIALQASPKHTGTRFLVRLARVNLISGEYAAAQKYLNILSKTLFYGKWARSMMPENQTPDVRDRIAQERSKLPKTDFVHHSSELRPILLGLLEANPDNMLARNYLLCCDLLHYDLDHFIEDYTPVLIKAHNYHEAVLIWLSLQDRMTQEDAALFGVDNSLIKRMEYFFRTPEKYRNTYWYYYMNAPEE